ncbi:glycosyltransferase family 4 protein [Sphingopyxis granuli]|uniref:glycosyltransferase family 4 protein n=1 Tax=Sphingopyxis granuli TaxID=267128 RepID=UPI001F53DDFC|nr:glycosyltransferase family 4 protein [Sphingopyxis granuli]UNK78554.1 glycosyltransferase family 4 protein [Sphingopyxis granuli]
MKILMVCEFYDESLEYQENLLAKYYALAGHDVTIVTSTIRSIQDYYHDRDRGKGERVEERTAHARIIRLPFRYNFLHRIKIFEPISTIVEEEKPDLLYFHDIIPNILEGVRYVKRHPECPMIMDYHADSTNSGANWLSRRVLHGVIRKAMLDRARPYLKKIFPTVPAGTEFLMKYYGVSEDEIEVLPLGTDQEFAAQILASGARERIRARLGIGEGELAIFTGGKLTPLKRTEDLLAAVDSLNDPTIHVIVAGTADATLADYSGMIERMTAGKANIHMVGWQDRSGVYEYMSAADLAIFPASQSVMWQQSLGMELPLIVSEWITGNRGVQHVGYLNRYNNLIILDPAPSYTTQIADHIRRLADDRATLAHMAEGARKTAAELLDYTIICATTLRYCNQRV